MPSTVGQEPPRNYLCCSAPDAACVVLRMTCTGSPRRTACGHFQMRKLRPEGFSEEPWSPGLPFSNKG